MPVYLALFRGINVSGHNMIKMDSLKKLMEGEGYSKVATYIQSGNVVFETPETNSDKVGKALETLMYKEYGYDVIIFMLSKQEIEAAIKYNPYTGPEPEGQGTKKLFVTFLSAQPAREHLDRIQRYNRSDDVFKAVGNILYLKLSQSAADSKLTNVFIENKLNLKATTRNWNTTLKLLEMLENHGK